MSHYRQGRLVLLITDVEQIVSLVVSVLPKQTTVKATSDGWHALEEIKRTPPNLVICDLNTPGLGDKEFVARLLSAPSVRDFALLTLAAPPFPFLPSGQEEGYPDAHLSKPLRLTELTNLVERLITRSQQT